MTQSPRAMPASAASRRGVALIVLFAVAALLAIDWSIALTLVPVTGVAAIAFVWMKRLPEFAPKADGTRRSRLAAASLAAEGFAVLCAVVAVKLGARIPDGASESGDIVIVFTLLALWMTLLGFFGGVVAWVQISGSGGRLTGKWQAVTATIVPVLLPCLMAPLAYVMSAVPPDTGTERLKPAHSAPVETK